MNNQALRDKLFHALRGELWPGNPELDQMALADVDAIMPIIEQHWEEEKKAWANLVEASILYPTADAILARADRVDVLDLSSWAKNVV